MIGNLPTVEGFDETKRSRYISECMFLRCWWYYRLNILYNGVPYYKDPIKDIDEAKLARSTQDEVWGYIVDDLTSCINNPDCRINTVRMMPITGILQKVQPML